jgi:Flp pilus assembly protein CpaB
MRSLPSLPSLFRLLRWHRRAIGIVALFVCLLSGLGIVMGPKPTGSPVVVTTQALPPGTQLTAADIRVTLAPADLVPAAALTTVDQAVGAHLAVGQPQGAMLTDLALSATEALSDVAAGEVLVPFRLADPDVLALLRVGSYLTVVSSQLDGQTSIVAEHVRVASLPDKADAGLLNAGTTSSSVLILVATDPVTGQKLAGAGGTTLGVMIENAS